LNPTGPTEAEFGELWGLIERRYGIVLPPDRRDLLLGDLRRSAWADEGIAGLTWRLRANDPQGVDWLLERVTVHHTGFFREPEAYRVFLDELLPRLRSRPVRVWSAASSTGEELYTLVFLLAERLGVEELREGWRFLGTDISTSAIARAEAGIYDALEVSAVPATLRASCFEPCTAGFLRVRSSLRELCVFRRLNLIDRPFPFRRPFDVVFCRNVLYYFSDEEQRAVLVGLHGVTAPGGVLLTGACDSVRQVRSPWRARSPILFERAP